MDCKPDSRASGYDHGEQDHKKPGRAAVAATLDPDADDQRYYRCKACWWPCINPVGTKPEQTELCLDCFVDGDRQAVLGEWR